MAVNVSKEYIETIYSGDAKSKAIIKFNNIELENVNLLAEKITIKRRIIPNGSQRFSLDNFISTEVELILHNVSLETIQEPVYISIGTLVGETYENVPIGIFKIEGTPTTDSDKTTIQLRDNAVKFDFNYNAQPLMKENDGSATLKQILDDICTQAEVEHKITTFDGEDISVGVFDNTITGRTYISYIAEQAGKIPVIDRDGKLMFIDINNDGETIEIPIRVVEKYELGEDYKIEKVEYEDAIRKFEKVNEETDGDYLYINTANPYISNQEQIDKIYENTNGFEINSVKTGTIMGNPAIDPWDFIKIVHKSRNMFNKNGDFTYGSNKHQTTLQEDGTIKVTSNYYNARSSGQLLQVEKNTVYNVSGILISANGTHGTNNANVEILNTSNKAIKKLNLATSLNKPYAFSFVFNSGNNESVWISLNGVNSSSAGLTETIFDKMQIEKGTNSSDYVDYFYREIKSLATYELTYNGVLTSKFDTSIGLEEKQTNVTVNSEESKFKRAYTRIDNVEGKVEIVTSETQDIKDDLNQNYYSKTIVNQLIQTAEQGVTNTFSEAGGNNIFRNTGLWFEQKTTKNLTFPSLDTFPSTYLYTGSEVDYEFWVGKVTKISEEKAANFSAMLLQKGTLYQEQIVPNGNYTVSFKYKKLIPLSTIYVKINDVQYELTEDKETEFVTGTVDENGEYIIQPLLVSAEHINVSFISDTNEACEVYDVMVNAGSVKLAYSQNQNETTTETVNISKGITITSSDTNVKFKADSDGIRVYDKNAKDTDEPITRFTDKGMNTKSMTVENEATICDMLIQRIGNQTWITKI